MSNAGLETITLGDEIRARELYSGDNAQFFWYLVEQKETDFLLTAVRMIVQLGENCKTYNVTTMINMVAQALAEQRAAERTQLYQLRVEQGDHDVSTIAGEPDAGIMQ